MVRLNLWVGAALAAGFLGAVGCTGEKPGTTAGTVGTGASSGAKDGGLLAELKALPAQVKIAIDGSSTVYPAIEAVAEEFQKAVDKKVGVTVGIAGTGGGFKRFVRGETDVSNASRPILAAEMEEAKKNGVEYIELPICFDALTIVVNPQNTWVKDVSVEDLKKLWEPKAEKTIVKWNQVKPEWPDEPILLFGAGTDSGTFDYFTEAVNGKAKQCRSDFTASENDNTLVQGVSGDKNALGFIPYAYYEPNKSKLKALAVSWSKNKVPEAVLPSEESVVKGTYNPLSRPLFIYINKKAAERKEVKAFVHFVLTEGPALFREVKYVPLQEAAYKLCEERFKTGQAGTAFGGHPEIGVPVEEILKKTPVSEAKPAAEAKPKG